MENCADSIFMGRYSYAVNPFIMLIAHRKIMTPEQFKMAKAGLGMSNPELAELTGLHRNTLNKLDKGEGKASTLKLVRLMLEAQGIQFLETGQIAAGPGVAIGSSPSSGSKRRPRDTRSAAGIARCRSGSHPVCLTIQGRPATPSALATGGASSRVRGARGHRRECGRADFAEKAG